MQCQSRAKGGLSRTRHVLPPFGGRWTQGLGSACRTFGPTLSLAELPFFEVELDSFAANGTEECTHSKLLLRLYALFLK